MASLFTYQRRVQRLLRDQRQQIINPGDIVDYVNEARAQLAGEAECLRLMGTLALNAAQRVYQFNSIVLPNAATLGIQGILNVRTGWYNVGSGQTWVRPRPFEWFSIYELNNPVPASGPPYAWAQFAQGGAGSIYLSPLPDITYTMQFDCVCSPVDLAADTDVEAIPSLWTHAVPYYATYLALLSMDTGGDSTPAEKMFQRYQEYVGRARQASTPSVLPGQYAQVPNVTRQAQLGQQQQGSG